MKKAVLTTISIILICTTLCNVVSATVPLGIIEYEYLSHKDKVYVTENFIEQINTYETIHDNLKSIWTFNNNTGTINFTVYKNDVLIHDKTILNPDYYPEVYGISYSKDLTDEDISAQSISSITEGEEDWWGYSYYFNTKSAQLDVYWRLWNPNSDIYPSKKYFFAAYGTLNQENATAFMDYVIDMENKETQVEAVVAIETINIIKSAVTLAVAAAAGSPAAICSLISGLEAARNLTTAQVELTADVYNTAQMADSCYLDVVDKIVESTGNN